jgi:predicted nucleic acid-binding Zn ribbon protein
MPLHNYRCLDCHALDRRIAALDDHTAICHTCGGLMLRQDDPWAVELWDDRINPQPRENRP